jgi:hypothetical protein
MKKRLLTSFFILFSIWIGNQGFAQSALAPDQNPSFAVARERYMRHADSITSTQGTTIQETYKAIDWLADKREARAERREYRRQLAIENARWGNNYYDDSYYYSPRYRGNNNYYRPYRNNYRRGSSIYINPWGIGYWWR